MSVVAKQLDELRCHLVWRQASVLGTQLSPKRGTAALPQFSAHIYCGQTVAHLTYC